jgi:hypothetical protein
MVSTADLRIGAKKAHIGLVEIYIVTFLLLILCADLIVYIVKARGFFSRALLNFVAF